MYFSAPENRPIVPRFGYGQILEGQAAEYTTYMSLKESEPNHLGKPVGAAAVYGAFAHMDDCGERVALKMAPMGDEATTDLVENEREMRLFIEGQASEGVVRLVNEDEVVEDTDGHTFPVAVTEYMDGGDLLDVSVRTAKEARLFGQRMQGCLAAIDFLHREGIVLRDIKPENIMHHRTTDTFKLNDLEHAQYRGYVGRLVGTKGYISPQRMNGEALTPADDVYALGATCLRTFTGLVPELFPEHLDTEDRALVRHVRIHAKMRKGAVPIEEMLFGTDGEGASPMKSYLPRQVIEALGYLPHDARDAVLSAISNHAADRPTVAELSRALLGD